MKQISRLLVSVGVLALAMLVSLPSPKAQASVQTPDPTLPLAFEAASVRQNTSAESRQSIRRQPGGRLTATNMPLRNLITFAYQLQPFQLVGDPSWIRDTRFDIVAKMEGDPAPVPPGMGPDPLMLAMRTLLAERFKLVAHRETREMDIYALVRLREDGLGPALKPTTQDCEAMMAAARRGAPPPESGPNGPVFCGIRGGFGRLRAGGIPMVLFANNLAQQVQRTVVDRTGLTGGWDLELTFSQEPPPGPLPPGVELPPVDPSAPSLFTAIQEQLGLRLQSTKGPVEAFVIDSVSQLIPD